MARSWCSPARCRPPTGPPPSGPVPADYTQADGWHEVRVLNRDRPAEEARVRRATWLRCRDWRPRAAGGSWSSTAGAERTPAPVDAGRGDSQVRREGMAVTRFKGLGEMNPRRLWRRRSTRHRTLLKVTLNDALAAEKEFRKLDGRGRGGPPRVHLRQAGHRPRELTMGVTRVTPVGRLRCRGSHPGTAAARPLPSMGARRQDAARPEAIRGFSKPTPLILGEARGELGSPEEAPDEGKLPLWVTSRLSATRSNNSISASGWPAREICRGRRPSFARGQRNLPNPGGQRRNSYHCGRPAGSPHATPASAKERRSARKEPAHRGAGPATRGPTIRPVRSSDCDQQFVVVLASGGGGEVSPRRLRPRRAHRRDKFP